MKPSRGRKRARSSRADKEQALDLFLKANTSEPGPQDPESAGKKHEHCWNTSDERRYKAQRESLDKLERDEIIVKCGNRIWRCDNLYLAERCDFFRIICLSQWRESASRIIFLDDDDPEAIEMIIDFLHYGKFSHFYSTHQAIKAFKAADKYDIPVLLNAAANHIFDKVTQIKSFGRCDEAGKAEIVRLIRAVWSLGLFDHDPIQSETIAQVLEVCGALEQHPHFREFLARDEGLREVFDKLMKERKELWQEEWNAVKRRRLPLGSLL